MHAQQFSSVKNKAQLIYKGGGGHRRRMRKQKPFSLTCKRKNSNFLTHKWSLLTTLRGADFVIYDKFDLAVWQFKREAVQLKEEVISFNLSRSGYPKFLRFCQITNWEIQNIYKNSTFISTLCFVMNRIETLKMNRTRGKCRIR